jgi:hypothetical protein
VKISHPEAMASIGHLPSDGFKRTEADEDVNVVDEDVALLVCYLKFLLYYYSWIFFIELNADRS